MPQGKRSSWIVRSGLAIAGALFAGAVAAAAGPSVYSRDLSSLYQSAGGTAVVGSLTPGTKLELAGASTVPASTGSGDREPVTIEGWSPKGAGSLVFAAPNVRILLLRMQPGASARRVIGQKKDAYGTTWRHVAVTGWVKRRDVTANLATVWGHARAIFSKRCSACHALHHPDEFTANQWPGILGTMAKNAALDPAQKALVTQYLQTHARGQ